MDELERRFHRTMIQVYQEAKAECNYNATYFLRLVNEKGGLRAAKQLLQGEAPAQGFTTLWECGRLDLSVEARVLRPEFAPLFTDKERAVARQRLQDYGYEP